MPNTTCTGIDTKEYFKSSSHLIWIESLLQYFDEMNSDAAKFHTWQPHQRTRRCHFWNGYHYWFHLIANIMRIWWKHPETEATDTLVLLHAFYLCLQNMLENMFKYLEQVNTLQPRYVIWQLRYWSTLVQINELTNGNIMLAICRFSFIKHSHHKLEIAKSPGYIEKLNKCCP